MISDHIAEPVTLESQLTTFEDIKEQDLTLATEILVYEHQSHLGKEDGNKELSELITTIENNGPQTDYQNALLNFLRGVKSYHLGASEADKFNTYSSIAEDLQKAAKIIEENKTPEREELLGMVYDYIGLATRNAGNKEEAAEILKTAREHASKKWRAFYIDFNYGRLTGDTKMLKRTAVARGKFAKEERHRYAEGDFHLDKEYVWALKNVLKLDDLTDKQRDYFQNCLDTTQEYIQKETIRLAKGDKSSGHFLDPFITTALPILYLAMDKLYDTADTAIKYLRNVA